MNHTPNAHFVIDPIKIIAIIWLCRSSKTSSKRTGDKAAWLFPNLIVRFFLINCRFQTEVDALKLTVARCITSSIPVEIHYFDLRAHRSSFYIWPFKGWWHLRKTKIVYSKKSFYARSLSSFRPIKDQPKWLVVSSNKPQVVITECSSSRSRRRNGSFLSYFVLLN